MDEWPKLLDFGVTCLLLMLLWKFADKYAGPFLDASRKQAEAMAVMAESVKASAGDSKEILLAVRVQSSLISGLQELIKERLTKERM